MPPLTLELIPNSGLAPCAHCSGAYRLSSLDPFSRCTQCSELQRCAQCGEWLGQDRELDEDGRCETCAGLRQCSCCGEWQDEDTIDDVGESTYCCSSRSSCTHCDGWADTLAPDDRCPECTRYNECASCGWTENIIAPDENCARCTGLCECVCCGEWVDSVDYEDRCEACEPPADSDETDSDETDSDETDSDEDETDETDPSEYRDSRARGSGSTNRELSVRLPRPIGACALIGVELEGGWNSPPAAAARYKQDGSVTIQAEWKSGEIPSAPLPVSDWFSVEDWISANYPDHVNRTCGIHVHLSFGVRNSEIIGRMRKDPKLLRMLLRRLDLWGKRNKVTNPRFWSRLRGENTYCKPVWQRTGTGRRFAINFEAYEEHGTVEVRILPMFQTVRVSLSAIREVVRIFNAYASYLDRKSVFDRRAQEALEIERATIAFSGYVPQPALVLS
jgi:hypothetical protein